MNLTITNIIFRLLILFNIIGQPNDVIYVKSESELFSAIASNKTIVINADQILLSRPIEIHKLKKLKISGKNEKRHTTLSYTQCNYPLISLKNSNMIELSNLDLVYSTQRTSCVGSLLEITECPTVKINNCNFTGKAEDNLEASVIMNLQVVDCNFYNANDQIMSLSHIEIANFYNCKFKKNVKDNWAGKFFLSGCSMLIFKNCEISDNQSKQVLFHHNAYEENERKCTKVNLINCKIKNNKEPNFTNLPIENFIFENTEFKDNSFILEEKK